MNKILGMKELLETLDISKGTYYNLINEKHKDHDPDFPKPCNLFTGKKLRWTSIDVDNYIASKSHCKAA